MTNRQAQQQGFTLIEALVAIMVLAIGLIPAFQTAATSLNLSTKIQNSLIASNLAQEGIEVVHAIRDANFFSGAPSFDTNINTANCTAATGCLVQWDSTGAPALSAAGASPPVLNIDANGMYTYAAGTATGFTRVIRVTQITANVEIKVTSTVTWSDRGGPVNTLVIEDYLFNWN